MNGMFLLVKHPFFIFIFANFGEIFVAVIYYKRIMSFNILIVDDHPIVREGLKVILSRLEGVTCDVCESVEQLTNIISRNICHDLYIIDLEFPKSDVFPVLGIINQKNPKAKIMIYTMHEEPWVLSRINTYNIHGYVSKSDSMETLCAAVDIIRNGGESFTDTFLKVRNSGYVSHDTEDVIITEREKQVLYYLSQGYSTHEIAEKLHISYLTAKTHRNHIAKKLHAKNAIEIVMRGKKYL